MAETLLALGGFVFGIDTAAYQTLMRQTAWRWPATERIGRAPAHQYVGPGEDRVTLQGILYPTFRGGLEQLDDLRSEAGLGVPRILVDQQGYLRGQWCIESIEETRSVFLPGGAPKRIEFSLTLVAYGEDAA